jgi:hypothetical protein
MPWLILLFQLSTQVGCGSQHGYFKNAGQICLLPADMDEAQGLLFADLIAKEGELASALQDQQEFRASNVAARVAALNARISFLEGKRDATNGGPVETYQAGIDGIEADRETLTGRRDEAAKLGPVISRLNREINELKRDLDASIP